MLETKIKKFVQNSYSMLIVSVSVSVYYVAVRTIVLSRHRSNLARPVIIHDIIHGLIVKYFRVYPVTTTSFSVFHFLITFSISFIVIRQFKLVKLGSCNLFLTKIRWLSSNELDCFEKSSAKSHFHLFNIASPIRTMFGNCGLRSRPIPVFPSCLQKSCWLCWCAWSSSFCCCFW